MVCITNFLYYRFQKRHANQIWWEVWNCMQPLGDMTFDHVVTKLRTLCHNFHKDAITKLSWNTWYHCFTWFVITRFLYFYISFLYVIRLGNVLKLHSPTSKKTITTRLGGNIYKNERVAYFHMAWVNHYMIIWYPDKWKEDIQLLQKLQNWCD